MHIMFTGAGTFADTEMGHEIEDEGENNSTDSITRAWHWRQLSENWEVGQTTLWTWLKSFQSGSCYTFARMHCFLYLCPHGFVFVAVPHKGLLAPQQVSANPEGSDNLLVKWTSPGEGATAVQEYVVEWRELHLRGGMQPPLSWLRSPPYNTSTLISGTSLFTIFLMSYKVHIFWGNCRWEPRAMPSVPGGCMRRGTVMT